MGLFDFLKKKPGDEPTSTPPSATPATPQQGAAPAQGTKPTEQAKPAGGPRYQRPAFAATSPEQMQPAMPAAPELPPLPEMPELPPFDPTNNLEQVLLLASQDPQYHQAFYHELLQSQLLVLTATPEDAEPGEITVAEGTEIQLQLLHDGRIPVFSSEGRIFEGGAPQGEISFIRVPAEGFFHMTRGAECVLNPFSPYGKLMVAQEIEALLSGNIFNQPGAGAQQQGPQAHLVPMAELPTELAEALREFCAKHPHIEATYLSHVQIEGEEAPSRMLLAFAVDGEDMDFLQELGPIVQAHMPQQEAIDVARLSPDPEEPLTQYFSQQEPVYQRVQA